MRFSVVLDGFDIISGTSSPTIWWRVYSADGSRFDCGHSSQDLLQDGVIKREFETTNSIFAWMRLDDGYHRKWQFHAEGILPLPSSSTTTKDNDATSNVTFVFDDQGQCHPSHFVLYVKNEASFGLNIRLGEMAVAKIPPSKTQEVVMESALYLRTNPDLEITVDDQDQSKIVEEEPLAPAPSAPDSPSGLRSTT